MHQKQQNLRARCMQLRWLYPSTNSSFGLVWGNMTEFQINQRYLRVYRHCGNILPMIMTLRKCGDVLECRYSPWTKMVLLFEFRARNIKSQWKVPVESIMFGFVVFETQVPPSLCTLCHGTTIKPFLPDWQTHSCVVLAFMVLFRCCLWFIDEIIQSTVDLW